MRPIPSREDLLALMHALLANASELVDDAELLLENERFPRAYALAALGGEELGKIYLCLDALLPIGEMDDKQFWREWRHHGGKIGSLQAYALAFVDDLEQLDLEDPGREADRITSQKLAAIYVDFVDGEVATPNTVAPLEASTLTGRVRAAVDHARQQLSRMNIDVIAAMEVMGPAIEGLMKESLARGDQKQVLAGFRQLLVDVPGMSGEELVSLLTAAVEDSDESGA